MKRAVLLLTGLAMALSLGIFAFGQGNAEKGKAVYEKERCKMCHSISGVGNKKYPLDGVGSELTAQQIKDWVKTPKKMDPKTIMRAYSNISEQDLNDLVAYLETLKKK